MRHHYGLTVLLQVKHSTGYLKASLRSDCICCVFGCCSRIKPLLVTESLMNILQYLCCLFFQGRLNELMSQIRMQNHFGAVKSEERYSVDADLLREIKQVRQHIYTAHRILASAQSNCSSRQLWFSRLWLPLNNIFKRFWALTETLLPDLSLSALETAAGGFKSFDQRHQRWPGGH